MYDIGSELAAINNYGAIDHFIFVLHNYIISLIAISDVWKKNVHNKICN